ncbi:hypothetical protein ES705_05481 [subsurface metagenome]
MSEELVNEWIAKAEEDYQAMEESQRRKKRKSVLI